MKRALLFLAAITVFACSADEVDFPFEEESKVGLTYIDKVEGSWVGVKTEEIRIEQGVKKTSTPPRHNGTMIIQAPTSANPGAFDPLTVSNMPIVYSGRFVFRGNKLSFLDGQAVPVRVTKVDSEELVLTFYMISGENTFTETSYYFSRPNPKLPGPVKPS